MQTELMVAGFGGQGALFTGQLLAYASMDEGLQVTWIPSYGPEMRGGTANCTVIVSNEDIGAPIVGKLRAGIALNRPSMDKLEPMIKPGGYLVVNASMVDRAAVRTDINVVSIPATEIAESLGDRRLTNMVLLGGLLGNVPVVTLEAIGRALKAHTAERNQKLVPANMEAMNRGATYVVEPVK